MTETSAESAFAAFRAAVAADFHLQLALRPLRDRDAFVKAVVAAGAARALVFDDTVVRAAMRAGEQTWLAMGADPA